MDYKHTQTGYLTIVALGAGMLAVAFIMAACGFNWAALIVLIILGVALWLFATLTIEIAKGQLQVRFGPGLVRKSFPTEDLASCRVVKNPWYYGWGIRLTPHGWLYNVSGSLGVEVQMKSGRKYRIGTDDPQGLAEAIQRSLTGQHGG